SGPLGLPAVSGTAPLLTTSSAFTNEAGFTTPPTGTTVKGLVRVTDQQDDSAPVPVTLDESLQPAAAAPSTRYQLFRVFVAGPSTGPTCLEYAPNAPALQATQGVGFRLDIDTAATPASDPDGIAGYRVDYNNDGTWDTGLRQPDGTPGGINSDMGSATGNVTYGAYPVFAADAAGDSYSAVYRSSAPGNGINVYRSLDGGVTWPGPGNLLPLFANGAYTTQNSSWSLGVLANGLPAIAARDGGSDLTFISAVSESAGTIDWGGSTRGVEIENLGTWDGVVLCPSRTNANRAYIVAINTSNTTGPNFDQICLWLSTNAASPNPTFTLLPTIADSMNGAAGQESGLRAVVDSGDDLHLVWEVPGGGQAMYRKFIDDGSATGGAWAAPEAVIAIQLPYTGGFRDFEIAVNAANEPAICWMDEDPNARPSNNGNTIYLTKFTTGSGWTTAQQVVNTITTRENFVFWPSLFFDNAGRIHLAWRDNREQATTTYEVWGSVWNGTGTMEIIDDFEILLAPSSTMDYINAPRNAYNPVFNKAIVAMQADFVPTDGYWRYRTYSLP
ncbi:MAG TPA: hypothetical protein VEI97_03520, partial [bacterium]|nr:hypothetical protein [bacterium]